MVTDEKVLIGAKIRELRERLNLSRPELAKRLGYKSGSLRAIEQGKFSPNERAMKILARLERQAREGVTGGSEGAVPLREDQPGDIPPAPTPEEERPGLAVAAAGVVSGSRRDRIADLYKFIGAGVALMGGDDPRAVQAAESIIQTGPPAAQAWEAWAAESPRVDAALSKLSAPSAGLAVMIVHAQLLAAIVLIYRKPLPDVEPPADDGAAVRDGAGTPLA